MTNRRYRGEVPLHASHLLPSHHRSRPFQRLGAGSELVPARPSKERCPVDLEQETKYVTAEERVIQSAEIKLVVRFDLSRSEGMKL